MVAGDGLVQREGLQHVERTTLERVGVDPVGARPSAADGGFHVAAARVLGGEVRGHGLDAVGQARQMAEERG